MYFIKFLKRKVNRIAHLMFRPLYVISLNKRLKKTEEEDRTSLSYLRDYYENQYLNNTEPLISVYIPTYNRADLLISRSVRSVLNQTYSNLELLVIGDALTDDTEAKLSALNDPRIKFYNLMERPPYPKNRYCRWMAIGSYARNLGLEIAEGDWIAYLDDDDAWETDHLEKMVQQSFVHPSSEFFYGGFKREESPGVWKSVANPNFMTGRPPFIGGSILHSSVMYRSYLRFMKYPTDGYKVGHALDYLLTLRIARAGVKWKFIPDLYAKQPLRPGELMSTHKSVKKYWPTMMNFILLKYVKNMDIH